LNLAEAMEARGFGRSGRTRAPRQPWTLTDRLALAAAPLIALGALWL
jgi:energy-coupling factor transporter transmembrane protein EcfT